MNPSSLNESHQFAWFRDISEIQPNHSAVLNGDYIFFYTIHYTAISLISISLISCLIVITSILFQRRKENKWDFSDRFPLYLAIADFLWSISHLTDHLVVVISEVYPSTTVGSLLSINLLFFLGYQQMMHAGLATYIYLKVVRIKSLKLGKGEWKLHSLCILVVVGSIAVFLPLRSFGSTGYWFLHNIQTIEGRILGFYIATSASMQAICTTVGYRSIRKVIESQNVSMLTYRDKSSTNITLLNPLKRHSVATQCLTTFVRISVILYCTLALTYWAFVIQTCFGVVEPSTAFVIVIVSNSSGWANTLGYFYNKRLKDKRRALITSSEEGVPSHSTASASSDK